MAVAFCLPLNDIIAEGRRGFTPIYVGLPCVIPFQALVLHYGFSFNKVSIIPCDVYVFMAYGTKQVLHKLQNLLKLAMCVCICLDYRVLMY